MFKSFLCQSISDDNHDVHPCLRSCGVCDSLAGPGTGGTGAGGGTGELRLGEQKQLVFPFSVKSVDLLSRANVATIGTGANFEADGTLVMRSPFYAALREMPPAMGTQWTIAADFQQEKSSRGCVRSGLVLFLGVVDHPYWLGEQHTFSCILVLFYVLVYRTCALWFAFILSAEPYRWWIMLRGPLPQACSPLTSTPRMHVSPTNPTPLDT